MASIPFGFDAYAGAAPAPTASPTQGYQQVPFEAQMYALGDLGRKNSPFSLMSAFYGNMPYYDAQLGGQTSANEQIFQNNLRAGRNPMTNLPGGPVVYRVGRRNATSGGTAGSGGTGSGTTTPPPVTPPVGSGTGVPLATSAYQPVQFLTPPPIGTGANWRNTMKYGV